MKLSDKGLDLIKKFEGCELTAYPDPGTGGDPWTIGYGHTGPEVKEGLAITQSEADEYLKNDVMKFEEGVTDLLEVEVTQGEFDALVSFAYNCGLGALRSSTLLRLLNAGNKLAASQQFSRWDKSGGRVLAGLTRRREAERQTFLA